MSNLVKDFLTLRKDAGLIVELSQEYIYRRGERTLDEALTYIVDVLDKWDMNVTGLPEHEKTGSAGTLSNVLEATYQVAESCRTFDKLGKDVVDYVEEHPETIWDLLWLISELGDRLLYEKELFF